MKNQHKRFIAGAICLAVALILGLAWMGKGNTIRAMLPVDQKVVIIDPGHGGWDPGRAGVDGANEDDLNLEVALRLQEYLEQAGAVVILTRNTDEALSEDKKGDMSARVETAQGEEGDIFISIHHNSFTSSSIHGAQTFYLEGDTEGQLLAEHIQSRLISEIDPANHRQAKDNKTYYILKYTELPSAIVECGFLTNPEEEASLNDSEYQGQLAWSIYLGIMDYFAEED